MTGVALPCLPNGAVCAGCRWWMPNAPDKCGHRLWKRLTDREERLPRACPIRIALTKNDPAPASSPFFDLISDALPDDPQWRAEHFNLLPGGSDFDPDAFTTDQFGNSWGNRVFTSRLGVTAVPDDKTARLKAVVEATARRAATEFTVALQKLMGDEAEAADALERLGRLRKELRAVVARLRAEADAGSWQSSFEDGRRDAFDAVLRMLDGKLRKMAGLDDEADGLSDEKEDPP